VPEQEGVDARQCTGIADYIPRKKSAFITIKNTKHSQLIQHKIIIRN